MPKTRRFHVDLLKHTDVRSGRILTRNYSDYVGNKRTYIQDNRTVKQVPTSRRKATGVSLSSFPGRYNTNPYHLDKLVCDVEPGFVSNHTDYLERNFKADGGFFSQWDNTDVSSYWHGFLGQYKDPHYIGPDFPGYYIGALKVNKKISEIDINAAVAFFERRKTLDLIAGNATKIVDAWDYLRSNDSRNAALALGVKPRKSKLVGGVLTLGPRWLELQYGWKPLLSDIHGALKLMHEKPPSWYVKSVTKSRRVVSELDYSGTVDTRLTFKALVTVTNPNLLNINSTGILNPALVAWELVPYSFVFDWFLPVGDYLASLTARSGLTLTEKSSTYTTTEKYKIRVVSSISPGPNSVSSKSGFRITQKTTRYSHAQDAVGKLYSKRKDRVPEFPDFPLPQLQSPLSLHHAITSVALLTSRRPATLRV